MTPVIVLRETEDTATSATVVVQVHSLINMDVFVVPANRGNGTTIHISKRWLPSGYTATEVGISIARPEKSFVVLHKDAMNRIRIIEGVCIPKGKEDFVR